MDLPSNTPMDLSIVVPILNDQQRFLQNYTEYEAFFKKFQVQFELLVVVSEADSLEVPLRQQSYCRVVVLDKPTSRNQAVATGIAAARGKFIAIATADQVTPLASYFSALQAFLSNSDLQLLAGNRYDPKRKPLGPENLKKQARAAQHIQFYRDMFELPQRDLCTPFLALRNSEQIQTIAQELQDINCWYYTPYWLLKMKTRSAEVLEISIQESRSAESQFKPVFDTLKMYWTALKMRA